MASAHQPEHTLVLPERIDMSAAAILAGSLLELGGTSVVLDAGAVERVHALAVQVLLSAARTRTGQLTTFRLANASPAVFDALGVLGIDPTQVNAR